jgi:hypothetical protein
VLLLCEIQESADRASRRAKPGLRRETLRCAVDVNFDEKKSAEDESTGDAQERLKSTVIIRCPDENRKSTVPAGVFHARPARSGQENLSKVQEVRRARFWSRSSDARNPTGIALFKAARA